MSPNAVSSNLMILTTNEISLQLAVTDGDISCLHKALSCRTVTYVQTDVRTHRKHVKRRSTSMRRFLCSKKGMKYGPKKLLLNTSLSDSFIHSFSSLSYDRSKASSNASSPHSAI